MKSDVAVAMLILADRRNRKRSGTSIPCRNAVTVAPRDMETSRKEKFAKEKFICHTRGDDSLLRGESYLFPLRASRITLYPE